MGTLAESGGIYTFNNGLVSFRLKPDATVDKVTILSIPREVMYFYPILAYWTPAGVAVSFYFSAIGNGTLTPSASPATTVSVTYTKTYVDAEGNTHNFTITVSLTDGEYHGKFNFHDVAVDPMNRVGFTLDARAYPQGYAAADTASANMGGDVNYVDPLNYDHSNYVWTAGGTIEIDGVDDLTGLNIDNYTVCYFTGVGPASVGFFGHYVDLHYLKEHSYINVINYQYVGINFNPRTIHEHEHELECYFGAWPDGSAASIQAAYAALDLVEALTPAEAPMLTRLLRTDLNTNLYNWNWKFEEILDNILTHNPSGPVGNCTMVPGGNVDWQYFKYRNNVSTWNRVVQSTGEDYVQKAIDMCQDHGIRLYVEIDILDALWTAANPADAAIGTDEVTPYTTTCKQVHSNQTLPTPSPYPGDWYITYDGGATWQVCPVCGGTGLKALWVQLLKLVTPGEAYHDAFIAYITYLCQNYNFYALILSECFYEMVDYCAAAKAQFIGDTGLADWPRTGAGAIDTNDATLGQWKTDKLSTLWDELTTLAHANNKKFILMVGANFDDKEAMARPRGQYWPTAIQHCDGLDVWDYYGSHSVPPSDTLIVVEKMRELQLLYPDKENVIAVGLWDAAGTSAISVADLQAGLDYLHTYWYDYGWGIEVTPSRFMLTAEYWDTLWGNDYPITVVAVSPSSGIQGDT